MTLTTTLFEPGEAVLLPGVEEALADSGEDLSLFLARHVSGDWSELSRTERSANTLALAIGGELLSVYRTSQGTKLRIVTEALRTKTYFYLDTEEGGDMKTDGIEPDMLFGSFTSAIGLALGELLLFTERREELPACLHLIETTAMATILSSRPKGEEITGRVAPPLVDAALSVVKAWHEEMDLTFLGDEVAKLQDVLEGVGVRYVPPRVTED